MRDNAGDPNLPKLNKQVALAAFPNGLVDQMPAEVTLDQAGKPSVTAGDFENFLVLRETYPAGAKVLNIYGDVLMEVSLMALFQSDRPKHYAIWSVPR